MLVPSRPPTTTSAGSRPGTAKILDPAIGSLLVCGDDVSPKVELGLAHLHVALVRVCDNDVVSTGSESSVRSNPDEIDAQEVRLWKCVVSLKRHEGLGSERTLWQTFKLVDCLIGQYKLNQTDKLLDEVAAVCAHRGGDWRIKWIQATAFCRWKQYRFKDALDLFLQQQEIVGPSAALCENIGHTLSSMGDLPSAEEYFQKAITLLEHGSYGNRGGIYMGLGLVRDRLGKTREAIPILQLSLDHYQKEHTRNFQQLDSSIIAKAHMSIGRAHEKLDELKMAASHMADALSIFRRTVGYDSPLTANSMGALGKVRAALGEPREALALLKGALELEVAKDAFHLETAWELLSRLKDLHMEGSRERQAELPAGEHGRHLQALHQTYAQFVPLVSAAVRRITPEHEREELGTLAVFFKTAGEMCMLAQDYALGETMLNKAVRLFAKVEGFDCSSLVQGCEMLLEIAAADGTGARAPNMAR